MKCLNARSNTLILNNFSNITELRSDVTTKATIRGFSAGIVIVKEGIPYRTSCAKAVALLKWLGLVGLFVNPAFG